MGCGMTAVAQCDQVGLGIVALLAAPGQMMNLQLAAAAARHRGVDMHGSVGVGILPDGEELVVGCPRDGRGCPLLEFDPAVVYSMAREGHSSRAIAEYLCCDPATIRRRFGRLLRAGWWEYRTRWARLNYDAAALSRAEEPYS